jgi:hypothetical protein
VQVDPIKPKLKPPGTKHLKKPKCDVLLSSSDFKCNLRHYIKELSSATGEILDNAELITTLENTKVGRCRLTLSNPC